MMVIQKLRVPWVIGWEKNTCATLHSMILKNQLTNRVHKVAQKQPSQEKDDLRIVGQNTSKQRAKT